MEDLWKISKLFNLLEIENVLEVSFLGPGDAPFITFQYKYMWVNKRGINLNFYVLNTYATQTMTHRYAHVWRTYRKYTTFVHIW